MRSCRRPGAFAEENRGSTHCSKKARGCRGDCSRAEQSSAGTDGNGSLGQDGRQNVTSSFLDRTGCGIPVGDVTVSPPFAAANPVAQVFTVSAAIGRVAHGKSIASLGHAKAAHIATEPAFVARGDAGQTASASTYGCRDGG